MDRIQDLLNKSIHHLQIANHMTYVTYPLVNEKRIFLRIIEEIHLAIINCINASIEFEMKLGNKKLTQSSSFRNEEPTIHWLKKDYKNYGLNEDNIKKIQEILEISNKHKESSMEFVRNEKIVILSNNLNIKILDISLVKSYLLTAKEFLLKVGKRINTETIS